MKMSNYYFNINDDLKRFPDCWAYFVWSGRNTGKTYSTLAHMLDTGARFLFVKRCVEDCKLLMSGSGKVGAKISQYGADFSPFKALNRDRGTNIRAFSIYKGYVGGFWHCDEHNAPLLDPIGYIVPLNAVSKVKGFDMSDCDYLIFDEFIPSRWERVDRNEGKQLLDLYMTVARDREHRGKEPLKLICLANPTEINCPIMQELEIADDASDMCIKGQEFREVRGMLLHQLQMGEDFIENEERMPIIQSMEGTAWKALTMGDGFAYNDLGMLKRIALKGFRCLLEIRYRKHLWYIYERDGTYYVCRSPNKPALGTFDLNKDADARRFFMEYAIDLKADYTEGRVLFQTYTMYDVLINYKKFFKI